jgi:hypothetical protein
MIRSETIEESKIVHRHEVNIKHSKRHCDELTDKSSTKV